MQILRSLALVSFVAGIGLLLIAFVFTNGNNGENVAADSGFTPLAATATPTRTATPPGATETATVPPTPTPAPFDGAVARLKIPRFGVDSKIEAIGIKPDNELDVPKDPLNTGWYDIYDKPGFGGNAVFSAHVDYFPDIKGPFYQLAKAEIGDEVIVTMENGQEYTYRVVTVNRYDVTTIPMGEIIWPTTKPAEAEWVTLITCGGQFVRTSESGAGIYLQRDVVVAERVREQPQS